MQSDFTDAEMQVLRDLIDTEQQRRAAERMRSLEEFQHILSAANSDLIDRIAQGAGNGDVGLVAVATAIGAPLSGYDLTDWPVLKGFIFGRLSVIRAQSFAGMP